MLVFVVMEKGINGVVGVFLNRSDADDACTHSDMWVDEEFVRGS